MVQKNGFKLIVTKVFIPSL